MLEREFEEINARLHIRLLNSAHSVEGQDMSRLRSAAPRPRSNPAADRPDDLRLVYVHYLYITLYRTLLPSGRPAQTPGVKPRAIWKPRDMDLELLLTGVLPRAALAMLPYIFLI